MKLPDAVDTAVIYCSQSTDVQQDTNSIGDSHAAPEDSGPCDLEAAFRRGIQLGGVRASLIRVNACAFSDRYVVSHPKEPLGQGASGSVHRCVDNLSGTARAVKRIPIPANRDRQLSLQREVSALVTLDHPHIVRLIEYFFEGSELQLVMELLEGPSLGSKMQEIGRFDEELAARCARHMLKAIFCCHCQGITHNDISAENFRFQTSAPGSSLKMVDFGLSERCSAWEEHNGCWVLSAEHEAARVHRQMSLHTLFAQENDIWGAGVLLFRMLSGEMLFPQLKSREFSAQLQVATDAGYVPSKIAQLEASSEAKNLLEGLLKLSTEQRLAARDALLHPFIKTHYRAKENVGGSHQPPEEHATQLLQQYVKALRDFHEAVRLKRLALVIAAHLLTSQGDTVESISWLFRYLVRDAQSVAEDELRRVLAELMVDTPDDLSTLFQSCDLSGTGVLDYVQFVASAIICEPIIYCRDVMLKAIFRFLDAEDVGSINDGTLGALFKLSMSKVSGMVEEACNSKSMKFDDFKAMMTPPWWWFDEVTGKVPAAWSEVPDAPIMSPSFASSRLPEAFTAAVAMTYNPVKSEKSEAFAVCQHPGFHQQALSPFYASQPISNVVIGIVKGTSAYARDAVKLGLAELVEVGEQRFGAFFFMPNPKYHWALNSIKTTETPEPNIRIVAWWIHPDFIAEMKTWLATCETVPSRKPSKASSPRCPSPLEEDAGVGCPGDFGFSSVAKPPCYLHTYRDLGGQDDLAMLEALVQAVGNFLKRILGEVMQSARLSAGFHYPVRPQYSTLHLQLRVNAGDVCGGSENRGVDLFKLLASLRSNPEVVRPDQETLYYQATANLRATLIAAAACAGRKVEEVGPKSFVLN